MRKPTAFVVFEERLDTDGTLGYRMKRVFDAKGEKDMAFTLIAHRCGPGAYPEQTIASARQALFAGADMVEMDVRETRDGALVICHDPDTGRMFGQSGLVSEIDLRDFLALRHESDRSYAPHTLEDVLACGVKPLLLHLKIGGERALGALCTLLKRYDARESAVLGAERTEDVRTIKRLSPETEILAFIPKPEDISAFAREEVRYIRFWEKWITDERVAQIRDAGKAVWIMAGTATELGVGYTSVDALRGFRDKGFDGVLVNDIPWAKKTLA